MKESLRDLMEFFLGNGEMIYYSTMGAVLLILGFSAFNAYRKREKTLAKLVCSQSKAKRKEKPMSSFDFFLDASDRGEEVSNEDYYKYRKEFDLYHATHEDEEENEDEEPLTRFEVLVEIYCPKLIWGCVFSLVLMAFVAAPYLIIKNFA